MFDNQQKFSYKINCSLSFLLRTNTEHPDTTNTPHENTTRYFYPSANTSLFPKSHLINSPSALHKFIKSFKDVDIPHYTSQDNTDSKWVLDHLGTLTFYITYMPHVVYEMDHSDPMLDNRQTNEAQHNIGHLKTPLPERLKNNPSVKNVRKDPEVAHTHPNNADNLCFLRCVAYSILKTELKHEPTPTQYNNKTKQLFERVYGNWEENSDSFKGTDLKDIVKIEDITNTCITLYRFINDTDENAPLMVKRKSRVPGSMINILLVNNHALLINNLKNLAQSWVCYTCSGVFSKKSNLDRHVKNAKCAEGYRETYVSGVYKTPQSMAEKLAAVGMEMKEPISKSFIVYDFEAVLKPLDKGAGRTKFSSEHVPISVSVASTVEGFEEAVFMLDTKDPQNLLNEFINYLNEISETHKTMFLEENKELVREFKTKIQNAKDRYEEEVKNIEEMKKRFDAEQKELEKNRDGSSTDGEGESEGTKTFNLKTSKKEQKDLEALYGEFIAYGSQISVVGFNSGKYDMNLTKPYLFQNFVETAPFNDSYVIKRNNAFLSIIPPSKNLKFLDISNYLSPGTSYASFLKCFNAQEMKGVFPFKWFTSPDKLDETQLPDRKEFYNELKDEHLTEKEYNKLLTIWEDNNMTSMRDYLEYYASLDVGPFVEALSNMIDLFAEHGLDILKDSVSISKLSFIFLLKSIPENLRDQAYFYCPSRRHKELVEDLRRSMLGGASIIFKRYAEAGKKIHDGGVETADCVTIEGYDCNSLYPFAMKQAMPCGHPIIRLKKRGYRAEHVGSSDRKSLQWFMWLKEKHGYKIEHKFNGPERRLGARGIAVDGFMKSMDSSPDTVFQFHGCYFHGCRNEKHGWKDHDFRRPGEASEQWIQIHNRTKAITSYLRNVLGFNVVEMRECDWDAQVATEKLAADIASRPIFQYQPIPKANRFRMTEGDICRAIKREVNPLFGFIVCDVHTPEHLKAKYDAFPLVYRHYDIDRDDLEPWMYDMAVEKGYLKQPSKLLITCHEATNILLATPLVKFYLEMGLIIKNINKVYQYNAVTCFEEFVTTCQEKRIAGDSDESKALYAKLYKDLANHSYGYTLTRKDRFKTVLYTNAQEMRSHCRKRTFCTASKVSDNDNLFEVILDKEDVKIDMPLQIGVMVYGLSKLKMLQFVYNCIFKFCKPSHVGLLSTDTDSLYMQLGASDLHGCLKPELKAEFYAAYDQWFPPPFCSKHKEDFIKTKMADESWPTPSTLNCESCKTAKARGNRTVGLFKSEYSGGRWFVGLCSKTYAVGVDDSDDNCKVTAKGISQRISKLRKENYLKVLETQQSGVGRINGLMAKNHKMFTYEQEKFGLSYFYCKRALAPDGINTKTLEVKKKENKSIIHHPPHYNPPPPSQQPQRHVDLRTLLSGAQTI